MTWRWPWTSRSGRHDAVARLGDALADLERARADVRHGFEVERDLDRRLRALRERVSDLDALARRLSVVNEANRLLLADILGEPRDRPMRDLLLLVRVLRTGGLSRVAAELDGSDAVLHEPGKYGVEVPPRLPRDTDFYEDDEPLADVQRAWDAGEHAVTAPPDAAGCQCREVDGIVEACDPCDTRIERDSALVGTDTPGCDCGHAGMGRWWHLDGCAWPGATDVNRP